ncbi:fluoride efflux transporter FluC [Kribbella sp. NPDC051587]|uniref:fluoride efflux transporter FluC n=1 Tax=Kribbella sp. NPDC051587 TaxID=3364119 RepID=UPI0037B4537C
MTETGQPRLPKVLGVVALGGIIGSLARYGLATAIPHAAGGFPWATFVTNVVGCLAIGILFARLTPPSHPLLRPFLGTGILGGFTTFSTYAVDTEKLLHAQMHAHLVIAFAYYFGTVAAALLAATLGEYLGRRR